MKDSIKSKEQLINELTVLRQRIIELETSETKRKQAEAELKKERHRLFSLLEGLPAFIYLQAPDYSIRFANRYFREYFGEPEGRPCYEVINGTKEPCQNCLTFRVFETREPQKWEWTQLDGRIHKIYDYPFNDIDGTPLVLELGIDITEQKQLEKSRSELLANVSHELRTPLMKIHGYVEALRDSLYKNENEFFHYLDIIYLNTIGINRLISDLFDLSQLEARQSIDFKIISLTQILPQYFDEISSFLEQKGLKFSFQMNDQLPFIAADTDRIIQVLNNLVTNAVRYTPASGLIQIIVSKYANGVLIEVADNGQGISEFDLPHVFTRFFKGKKRENTKTGKGTGLGLAIVKAIIEAHRGKVWVESRPGQGCHFYFTIPGQF